MTAVVWFRKDLRLADNPAWAAATLDDEVIPVFVIEPDLWRRGHNRTRQLSAELSALDQALAKRGGRLHVVEGPATRAIPQLAADGHSVHWNEDWSPVGSRRDAVVAAQLSSRGQAHQGSVVHPPGTILTGAGGPFKVFTAFYRRWVDARLPEIRPENDDALVRADPGIGIPSGGGTPLYEAGESAAADRLQAFQEHVDGYATLRDRPDLDRTSRLSADLKFGTMSPRNVLEEIGDSTPGRQAFTRQLAWRDFYVQALAAAPDSVAQPTRAEYEAIDWRNDPQGLEAWQSGRTGYPFIDAGMRQLIAEGWMHNRVRMATASFLVKDLLVDWRVGERHFRRYLVDGDIAQNVGNWQWVAGTGYDASPYFRVFNPIRQSEKFDPEGDYIRRWVPELRSLPTKLIHAPFAKPSHVLDHGVALGDTYPLPLVDHSEARKRAIGAYEAARERGRP